VLVDLTKIAASFIPFISEAMYRNLRSQTMPDSVHLCLFPTYHAEWRDETLEAEMAAVQTTVSLGHGLRKEHKLKVRQPLAAAHIASGDERILHFLRDQQHLIADELNVKDVLFGSHEEEFVHLIAKPNFRVLGKKVGKLMKAAQTAIENLDQERLGLLMDGQNVPIKIEGEEVVLSPEDVQVERRVREGMIAANEGAITIALDTTLNEELLNEGLAREIVNKINTMRREAEFEVTDRIHVRMQTTDRVQKCYAQFADYICGEVLALSVDFGPCEGNEWDLNGELAKIVLSKERT
jgi:isoleucyl-tRNA synthetase